MNKTSSQKPSVLHLISSSGFLGAEHILIELASHANLSGLDVTIGVFENSRNPNYELVNVARKQGLEVKIFPCEGRFDRNTVKMIRDYIKRSDINLLHSHNYKSNFFAWIALSSQKSVKWVITNHGRRLGQMLFLYHFINILIMRRADKVIAVSEEIAFEMKKQGISEKKIILIHNGVDFDKFTNIKTTDELRRSFGFNGTSKIVGTVASLSPEKGHVYLLKAARQVIEKCPECCFLIVGDGGQRQILEEKTSHLGLMEKVLFTGSRKDVPEILSILDVFVLPSLKEGLPMALLEAMASKVPVIATSVGAIPMVVEDGMSGMLIPPKNSDAIAEAINTMLSDGNSAKEMALRGFEKVRDHYSSKHMAEKYLTVYKDLLS
jgi:glycosyltransferase involved in cell wall biosynthesis